MYFPLFVDISEKRILVAGAGKIAARRVETLSMFASRITVVAPYVCREIERLEQTGKICCMRRVFQDVDLEGKEIDVYKRQKGYSADCVKAVDRKEYKERQYDLLADIIRENLDMQAIYEMIEKGNKMPCQ